jgi:cold-inducible RNA-binding protein
MGSKLYVGNLSYDTSEEDLREAFAADGRTVQEVAVVMDRDTGRPRGFAFVTMGNDADAKSAIAALDGQVLGGRTIKVSESHDKPGGGGRGGRGGGGGNRGRDSRW